MKLLKVSPPPSPRPSAQPAQLANPAKNNSRFLYLISKLHRLPRRDLSGEPQSSTRWHVEKRGRKRELPHPVGSSKVLYGLSRNFILFLNVCWPVWFSKQPFMPRDGRHYFFGYECCLWNICLKPFRYTQRCRSEVYLSGDTSALITNYPDARIKSYFRPRVKLCVFKIKKPTQGIFKLLAHRTLRIKTPPQPPADC